MERKTTSLDTIYVQLHWVMPCFAAGENGEFFFFQSYFCLFKINFEIFIRLGQCGTVRHPSASPRLIQFSNLDTSYYSIFPVFLTKTSPFPHPMSHRRHPTPHQIRHKIYQLKMSRFNIRNIKLINCFGFPGQLNISQSDIWNYYDTLM